MILKKVQKNIKFFHNFEKVQKNTKFFHIFEKTDYQKYILTMDDDLDSDFDGIKKINVIDC